MEVLDRDITDVQAGLQTVSIGVEAMKRLDVVNQSISDLEVSLSTRYNFLI